MAPVTKYTLLERPAALGKLQHLLVVVRLEHEQAASAQHYARGGGDHTEVGGDADAHPAAVDAEGKRGQTRMLIS